MPFLFYKYGHLLRRHSRYAPWTPPSTEKGAPVPPKDEPDELEPEYAPGAGENSGEDPDPEKRIKAIA
jgi:hypothetical protein